MSKNRKASAPNPVAQGLFDEALRHHQAGRLAEAEPLYRQALAVDPHHAGTLHALGVLARQVGRVDMAVDLIQQALAIKSGVPAYHNNLGTALQDQGKLAEALAQYKRAVMIKPDYAAAYVNMGNVLKEQNKLEEAIAYYKRAISLEPTLAEVHNNLGTVLKDQGKFDEALAHYERALAIKPQNSETYINIGNMLKDQGEVSDAIARYERALTLNPQSAEALNGLGATHKMQGQYKEALAFYARALALRPDYAEVRYNDGMLRLLMGDFEEGWRQSEWRWKKKEMKPHGFTAPLWDGGSLRGKTLLLHCEQGAGDSFQFIRYAGMIEKDGGRIILVCPSSLSKILGTMDVFDEIFESTDIPSYDFQAPLLSLPYILGTRCGTIPALVPYLRAEPSLISTWRERLQGYAGPKVGIVWRGNPAHKNDLNRSMKSKDFAGFLDNPELVVINLQKDAREDEIAALNVKGSFFNAAPDLHDYSDTAALLANLDLVISVDTSVCHLAGALAVPVWTLIPYVPDWRWLLGRDDSPWYPTMRLFRQQEKGDWSNVIESVRAALQIMAIGYNIA